MSRLFVIGLSHRTAPIEIREALAVSDDTVQSKLLEAARLCGEAMLLSTCNRFELYGSIPDGMADAAALSAIQELLTAGGPPPPPIICTATSAKWQCDTCFGSQPASTPWCLVSRRSWDR